MPAEQSSAAASSSSGSDGASLKDFWRLPSELQQRILLLACRAPAYTDKDFDKRSTLALDLATTRSLALVSRQLYPQIVTLLYSHVKIITVSALRSFQQALSSRPALGRLVKSLHLGPADDLPARWWPLLIDPENNGFELDYPRFYIMTSWSEGDEGKRPRWCEPHRDWNVRGDSFWNRECYDRAVHRAIKGAKDALDAAPCQPHCSRDNVRVGRVSRSSKPTSRAKLMFASYRHCRTLGPSRSGSCKPASTSTSRRCAKSKISTATMFPRGRLTNGKAPITLLNAGTRSAATTPS